MFRWSLSFLERCFDNQGITPWCLGSLVLSALNMLIQVFLSATFGDKSVLKIGGKR